MANIKLKDLINELRIAGGIVTESPWAKTENDTPSINVNELVSSIKKYWPLCSIKIVGSDSLISNTFLLSFPTGGRSPIFESP